MRDFSRTVFAIPDPNRPKGLQYLFASDIEARWEVPTWIHQFPPTLAKLIELRTRALLERDEVAIGAVALFVEARGEAIGGGYSDEKSWRMQLRATFRMEEGELERVMEGARKVVETEEEFKLVKRCFEDLKDKQKWFVVFFPFPTFHSTAPSDSFLSAVLRT